MALNVGPDFKQRWLNVPDAVRQAFIDDLSRVCDVLKPETGLHSWIEQDQRAQAVSTQKIEQAYAALQISSDELIGAQQQLALLQQHTNPAAQALLRQQRLQSNCQQHQTQTAGQKQLQK